MDSLELIARLRELAAERPRFGYRRLGTLLRREGVVVNHKRLLRIYRIEIVFYLCDALTYWHGFTDPHSEKVKKDLCKNIKGHLDYWNQFLSEFESCGNATDVDTDGGGVVDDVHYIYPEYELLDYTLQEINFSIPLSACTSYCP